jgi:ATP-binding cassette, subfamily B, bacterial HlyB/CyaB
MLARLRPVLWELGIASVVINLLALATPLFLMTVYNKVINHGALQTLDVLVFGMVTLFTFEWVLRSLRSYVASHTGGRLDAALGSEVIHHLVHLPLRTFERMATSSNEPGSSTASASSSQARCRCCWSICSSSACS